ncbi:MAG: substrate-binding domain-containing protein [Rhizonema sp. PD37]|nr:substrate-binding domain-containing protein [Rhizonema sp. PD37]
MFLHKKHSSLTKMQLSVVVLSLTTTQSLLGSFPLTRVEPVFAQSSNPAPSPSPSFPLPQSLPQGTTVKVDGSSSMRVINEALRQRFEQKYPDTKIELATAGSDQALTALRRGDINLAAIGRPLTSQEKAQGLVFVPVSREKIAIIEGKDNSFQKDLSFEQFAKMFRGEITDWSAVGGSPGKIRFIDHPIDGDTRRSLSTYDIFKKAPFQSGANTTRLAQDDTTSIVSALGKDGISYAIADQVLNLPNVRVIPMHKTLPSDPRYPYSQPRGYVYRAQSTTPGLLAFLGFVTSAPGKEIVAVAKQQESDAVRQSTAVAPLPIPNNAQTGVVQTSTRSENSGFPWWLLLLLIAIPYLLFLWLFLLRRRDRRSVATEDAMNIKSARQNREIAAILLPQLQTDIAERIDSILVLRMPEQTREITNLLLQQLQTDFDARIESIMNLKMAHQTQQITSLVLQQLQTDLDPRIESIMNLKMAHQTQQITSLVLQQLQTDLDPRIESIMNLKMAHQTQQITSLVLQQLQTDLDPRIESIMNLKMTHQTQQITSLVLQQMQTNLDQLINIDSIKAAIFSELKKQQFYLEMSSLKAELENFYARLEQFETQLYSRINQRDTEFYNWTHSQLLTLQGCLTDRQALIEQFESLSIRLKTELDNVACVNPNSFTPWMGIGVQSQLSSVQPPHLPER